ncbi:pyruvate transporter 0 [Trypanosoma grayi]|uniref:pyruvate transporter 0 n=1 Tax=Trypanosoma grayi TaxID=71804 RepID=UPI0004F42E81|nr:pyruvate transporter 0 [Trypanosoma grayi]KEG07794.1 pyruvate transporter 0 [Trypanosoma grayi]
MVQLVDDLFRMRMLVAGVYAGLVVSSTYGFSIFTEHMRNKYGLSQTDITTITTVGNCVNYCSFLGGMLFDFAGPMVVLPLAGFLVFVGFGLFGLTFDDKIQTASTVLFSIYMGIAHLGIPSMDVSAVMPLMLQLPMDRGYVVMIQKTFSGLGTSVLMAYFNGWFKAVDSNDLSDNNYSGYAYFLGAQALVCAFVGTYFIRLPMYFPCDWTKKRLSAEEWAERSGTLELYMKQRAPMRRLRIGFALVLAVLVFSTTQSITTAYVKTSHGGYLAIAIIAVVLLASFSVIALPFQFLGRYTPVKPTHMEGIGEAATEQLDGSAPVDEVNSDDADGSGTGRVANRVAPQYRASFWVHLLSLHLWGLWFTCFGAWGTGAVMQMNAAQIYRSKNYGEVDTPTLTLYVAIMAVGSAIGRISVGVLDMILMNRHREGKTRVLTTIALPLGPLLLFVAFLFFAVLPQQALILPFLLGSMGNGIGWGGGVLAARMMYARDAGKHYDFLFSSGFVASIALNRFMFGEMYDSQAHQQGTFPACNDPMCVRNQMFILMAINVLATFAAVLVHLRFARFTAEKDREEASLGMPKRSGNDVLATDPPEPFEGGNRVE